MRVSIIMTFLLASLIAQAEIKQDYLQLASRLDVIDKHFGLERIYASHIDGKTLLNSAEPEKILLQARISQIEAIVSMQGLAERNIASTNKRKYSMKQRIQRLENIMKRSEK